jgi:hypothetical protein
MNWQEILAIVVPLIGLMGWFHHNLMSEIKELRKDVKALDLRIQGVENRMSRIEGVLYGPYHWEPALKKKNDSQ